MLLGAYANMALFCTGSAIGGVLRRGPRARRRRAGGPCSWGIAEARSAPRKGSNRLRDADEGLVGVCPQKLVVKAVTFAEQRRQGGARATWQCGRWAPGIPSA